jgi:dTDP-4-dehydrorhamnose reductase
MSFATLIENCGQVEEQAMRILVTGAGGQLGSAVSKIAKSFEIISLDAHALDITNSHEIEERFDEVAPDVVLNAAAYTAVDRAESDTDRAMQVNGHAVQLLAAACRRHGAKLVHVSTDFIFDGTASSPIATSETPSPMSVYGHTKLAGELACKKELDENQALIVRTAWVYAAGHPNFVTTMLGLMNSRDQVRIVADQIGTPTWAVTLAGTTLDLISKGASGVFHVTDSGVASWFDFAVAIYELGRKHGLVRKEVEIIPIPSSEFATAAERPKYSVLDKSSTYELLGQATPHWRATLEACLSDWAKVRSDSMSESQPD